MSTKYEIVAELARNRVVEEMVRNTVRIHTLTPELLDLAQIVYEILLEKSEQVIVDLWENDQLDYYVSRIITNQYHSTSSRFWYTLREFPARSEELNPADYDKRQEERAYGKKR